jgi:CO/xanthine dehydrogenase Mo-binding subunit
MGGHFVESRRAFLKGVGAAGVTLVVRHSISPARATAAYPKAWMAAPGKARHRIEGFSKVRGDKIYARDFRAADIDGWPARENMALAIRAIHVDRRFAGLDLSPLADAGIAPRRVVMASDLDADGIGPPEFQQPPAGVRNGLMVAKNDFPGYFGQPLALLIFADYRDERKARRLLQSDMTVARYGAREPIESRTVPYNPATYVTFYRDAKGERFSQVKNGRANPYAVNPTPTGREARQWRERIDEAIAHPKFRTFEANCTTQPLDPVFLEPESGLAWLDRTAADPTLHLVLGTQSGDEDILIAQELFDAAGITTVVLNSCYPGGGFGGRVRSPFLTLLSLAAFYSDGPVRIAFDRFEQFQAGLKQLGSDITHRVATDGSGKFRAIKSKVVLSAGGNDNVSEWAAQLSGYSALGSYAIDQAAIDAMAVPTCGVVAGSMRGFGGVQVTFAIETLIEDIAQGMAIDPIELRRRNVLHSGDATVTGGRPGQVMRLVDICDLAAERSVWRERERDKERLSRNGKLYGVGFALANQSFGTGLDAVMAEVSISAEGEIAVRTNAVDMGNGSATSLALTTDAALGHNAGTIHMGDTALLKAALGLDTTTMRPGNNWSDPRWTLAMPGASGACLTAFHQVHAVEQAALALFQTGITAAAHGLWGITGRTQLRVASQPRWEGGRLVEAGRRPLAIAELAAEIYRRNLVSGAAVHALHMDRWVRTEFEVDGRTFALESDGLSTRRAREAAWRRHDRRNVVVPNENVYRLGRSLFTPSGALVAVEIDRASGRVAVIDVETFVDAGRIIQPDLVAGQSDGGVAMGIGYALMENAPNGEDGPGGGFWNLHLYDVARAGDMPAAMKLTLLGKDDPVAKGIAEAVLCPVPAAIATAVAHATGHRPHTLPITPDWVRKVLAS